jgi:two-component system LytT family sensor kinase
LSDLLRAALDGSNAQEVPLSRELKMLNLYLSIEQTRFGSRLTTTMDIAPDTLDAQVPNLILQPLVENAIRHGIEPRSKPGRIELRARRQADVLTMEVSDNGVGLRKNAAVEEGIGLSNTRARLHELYGPAHRLELVEPSDGGLRIELSIPFRQKSLHEDKNSDRR